MRVALIYYFDFYFLTFYFSTFYFSTSYFLVPLSCLIGKADRMFVEYNDEKKELKIINLYSTVDPDNITSVAVDFPLDKKSEQRTGIPNCKIYNLGQRQSQRKRQNNSSANHFLLSVNFANSADSVDYNIENDNKNLPSSEKSISFDLPVLFHLQLPNFVVKVKRLELGDEILSYSIKRPHAVLEGCFYACPFLNTSGKRYWSDHYNLLKTNIDDDGKLSVSKLNDEKITSGWLANPNSENLELDNVDTKKIQTIHYCHAFNIGDAPFSCECVDSETDDKFMDHCYWTYFVFKHTLVNHHDYKDSKINLL